MADFKSLTLAECADILLDIERPLVVMHIRPDGDTVGSGAALCKIFEKLGKEAFYTCADEIPERLAFLTKGLKKAENYDGLSAISVDVASPSQMGELYGKTDIKLAIDHHAQNTPYSPNCTLSDASSAGEVLYLVACELEERGVLTLDKETAALIYASISSDTGGFIFSSAREKTYLVAARLISLGIDHAEINRLLFHSKPEIQLKAEGYVATKIKTANDRKIAYAVITKAERDAMGLPLTAFDCAIDVVRTLMGIECAFVIKETDKGEFKASLRSSGRNVAEIAARHGGGGHIRAAGCTVSAECADSAAEILLSELLERR